MFENDDDDGRTDAGPWVYYTISSNISLRLTCAKNEEKKRREGVSLCNNKSIEEKNMGPLNFHIIPHTKFQDPSS